MLRLLLVGLLAVSFGTTAAEDDGDGFIWIDANTRIKIKPVKAAAGATAPEKAAPKPEQKPEQKEKPQK